MIVFVIDWNLISAKCNDWGGDKKSSALLRDVQQLHCMPAAAGIALITEALICPILASSTSSPHPSTLQSPWIVAGDATRAAWLSHVGVYRSSQLHSLACSVSCLVYQRAAWSPIDQCDCDSQSYIRSTSIDHASVAAVTILSHCFRLRSDRVDNRRFD